MLRFPRMETPTRLPLREPALRLVLAGTIAASASLGAAADLVVRQDRLIDSDLQVDGSILIENGATLTLRDARLTLQLEFDEEHFIDIEPGARMVIDNGVITSTGGQYWIELAGVPGEAPPELQVHGQSSWITNHSGIRPFANARVTVTGGDVEELQVREQTVVDLSDAATYPVFFFDGVEAALSNLDTGTSITNTVAVPGGWSFSLRRARVEGYQIDLQNGARVVLDSGDGIVVSLHTPGNLGDELQIVDGVTSEEPISGAITNLGSSFTFTSSNIALINVYTFGTDRVLVRNAHVNEVNAEQSSELIIGQKGYTTRLNCNLCQVYDTALLSVVAADIDARDNLPSATSSYADFEPVGRGTMRFVETDLRQLDLAARDEGRLELLGVELDRSRLQVSSPSATVVEAETAARFTATRLSGAAPLAVSFFDQSSGATRWEWSFGDGGSSQEQSPTHVYQGSGSYTVSLTVEGPGGRDTVTRPAYVQVTEPGGGVVCQPDQNVLCLSGGRFSVRVRWRDFAGKTGSASVVPFGSSDSGLFWFFDPDNWEMLVKVIRGCDLNGHYWVFASATTDVEYTLEVTDTVSGQTRVWSNPLGVASAAITDTSAFATCP